MKTKGTDDRILCDILKEDLDSILKEIPPFKTLKLCGTLILDETTKVYRMQPAAYYFGLIEEIYPALEYFGSIYSAAVYPSVVQKHDRKSFGMLPRDSYTNGVRWTWNCNRHSLLPTGQSHDSESPQNISKNAPFSLSLDVGHDPLTQDISIENKVEKDPINLLVVRFTNNSSFSIVFKRVCGEGTLNNGWSMEFNNFNDRVEIEDGVSLDNGSIWCSITPNRLLKGEELRKIVIELSYRIGLLTDYMINVERGTLE